MLKCRLLLFLKGMAMGAADVVPGVSGGTVAFITGIYAELISSIHRISPGSLLVLKEKGLKEFWQHINATFLITLLAGMLTSFLSLAHLVTWLLSAYPPVVWSFFFGLLVASVYYLAKNVKTWDSKTAPALLTGLIIAYAITNIAPLQIEPTNPNIFFAGMIAITAMILPGISGSFILLIMGLYNPMMTALKNFDMPLILLFVLGCASGLMLFSKVLNWAFNHFQQVTYSLLTGFLIGSINKIWPWKHTVSTYTDRHGVVKPLLQENVSPFAFETLEGLPSYVYLSIVMMIVGVAVILLLNNCSDRPAKSCAMNHN